MAAGGGWSGLVKHILTTLGVASSSFVSLCCTDLIPRVAQVRENL